MLSGVVGTAIRGSGVSCSCVKFDDSADAVVFVSISWLNEQVHLPPISCAKEAGEKFGSCLLARARSCFL